MVRARAGVRDSPDAPLRDLLLSSGYGSQVIASGRSRDMLVCLLMMRPQGHIVLEYLSGMYFVFIYLVVYFLICCLFADGGATASE